MVQPGPIHSRQGAAPQPQNPTPIAPEAGPQEASLPRQPGDHQETLLQELPARQNADAEARFAAAPGAAPTGQGLRANDLVAQANFQRAGQATPADQTTPPPPKDVKESEFKRNWHLGVGYNGLALNELAAPQRKHLAAADGNADGRLTADEAWQYVDQKLDASPKANDGKATVQPTATATEFEQTLKQLFTERSGRVVEAFDHSDIKGDVLYIQMNRNDGQTREERDVAKYVARDKDDPSLTRKDMTADFNAWKDPAEGKAAFKQKMRDYIHQLKADGKSMTGLILSGHSDGVNMLQELPDHTYVPKLDVREALRELRAEDPEIAQYFDQAEYVTLQACFQGEASGEWAALFPNATIVGTKSFGPLAATRDAGKQAEIAIKGHTAVEYGGDSADVRRATKRSISQNLRERGLVLDIPEQRLANAQSQRTQARDQFNGRNDEFKAIQDAYDDLFYGPNNLSHEDVVKQLAQDINDGKLSAPGKLKELYEISNQRFLSERGAAILEGQDVYSFNVDLFGQQEPIGALEELKGLLFDLRFAINDAH